MSYTEDSENDWKDTKEVQLKIEKGFKTKYSQKFCEKWMSAFKPWLTRCHDDPNKPFCKACQTRLDCNRCHLQRHEQTSKHARNLEILLKKGEVAAKQNLSIRQERSKYYQQRKRSNVIIESETHEVPDIAIGTHEDYIEEYLPPNSQMHKKAEQESAEFDFVQSVPNEEYHEESMMKHELTDDQEQQHTIPLRTSGQKMIGNLRKNQVQNTNSIQTPKQQNITLKKERIKLLMQIQQDRSELLHSFKDIVQTSPLREKSHVDLFFDSVSSSVKALSPKLVAEAKMRVSQLICELELRALTESNAIDNTDTAATVMVTSDPTNSYIINSGVGQVVHSEQSQSGGEQNYSALS